MPLHALLYLDRQVIDSIGRPRQKTAIFSSELRNSGDLEFLFAQLQPDKETVDTTPNCGNMLAAVVPFALETGLVEAKGEQTTLRVLTLNTNMQCDITVNTPGGRITYEGDASIDGVPGGSAPITINFLDTAGSVCSGLLPTGNVTDVIDGIEVNPRYKACFACTTAQAFAKTLEQAGYATDPAYADKVIGLIKQHNLLSLDGGAA